MKHGKFMIGMVIVALAAMLFAACPARKAIDETVVVKSQEKRGFTFRLAPESSLEQNYRSMIERNNNQLQTLINDVRQGLQLDQIVWNERMGGTYLKKPMLIDDGIPIQDPKAILQRLNVIFRNPNVKIQNILVELEYLPYGSDRWNHYNPEVDPAIAPENQRDIIAHIRTTLLQRSNPGTVVVYGEAPHRRICEPEF